MSIDLSRPQVASEGQHDALDGYLTCRELQASFTGDAHLDLSAEVRALAGLCRGRSFDTEDPLGIGGLLCDAHRLAQLERHGAAEDARLLEELLLASLRGLQPLADRAVFDGPSERRLAFRELGLSIGLHAAERILRTGVEGGRVDALLRDLVLQLPLAGRIERFWIDPARRKSPSWLDHRDINDVMLATSLAPSGYLAVGKGSSPMTRV